ncbi:hypothetical protein OIV19_20415 [Brucella sp. HL-2]|nr:hypothetical protein [Brucella sp. HL-2]MCV9909966.1 hypothetical protein [Brucella sp. HL-2]
MTLIDRLSKLVRGKKPEKFTSKTKYYRAFYHEMLRYWPGVTSSEAREYAREYTSAQFGASGFDWSEEAARDLARRYVEEFGEASHGE